MANGGFDDFFNAVPQDTVGIAKMKNVQCESCHGPVQLGVNHGDSTTVRPQAEVCGDCHQDTHHPYFEEWELSGHARSDSSDSGPFLTNLFKTSSGCSGCHTYQGFLEFVEDSLALEPDVQNPPGDASLPLVCAACHDPHGNSNEGNLRLATEQICVKCHNPEYPPEDAGTQVGQDVHHSTAYMFEGIGGFEYPGVTYSNSPHKFVVTRKCAECHVFMTDFQDGPPVIPASTGHTFEPSKYSCAEAGCHPSIDTTQTAEVVFNYKNRQMEMDSLASVLAGLLGTASDAQDSSSLGWLRAKFNYDFFESDGSHGVHNTNYARGLLQSAIDNFSLTGVEPLETGVPLEFGLAQNYPNPFNPTTVIEFALPAKQTVRLSVYDVTGKLIRTLVNEEMGAGSYKVTWNADHANGTKVASGMYFYRIEAGSFVTARKMLLIK
jgi:predicted CXXCH cytochrome family protein